MIVVVDFGAGNVGSVANMLRKIGAPVVVSDDPDVIGDAERLVVPGVGAFDVAMASIEERGAHALAETALMNFLQRS